MRLLLTIAVALTLCCAAQEPLSAVPRAPAAQHARTILCKLQIVVTEKGRVEDPKVIRTTGDKELDGKAVQAAKQWVFQPAKMNGHPVRVRAAMDVLFRSPEHAGETQKAELIEVNPALLSRSDENKNTAPK
jgi:TonB family protein